MKLKNLVPLASLALCVPLASCAGNSASSVTEVSHPRVEVDSSGAQWAPSPQEEFRNAQCNLTPSSVPSYPETYGLKIPGIFESPLQNSFDLEFPEAPAGMWWEQSAPIGTTDFGPAITAGHVDYAPGVLSPEGGELSPWGSLHSVTECTRLFATDAEGKTSEYTITSKYTVNQEAIATTGILDPNHPANLVLITCSGRTLQDVGAEHQFKYEYNLVIEATLISTI